MTFTNVLYGKQFHDSKERKQLKEKAPFQLYVGLSTTTFTAGYKYQI
jgi:hypothetical protein